MIRMDIKDLLANRWVSRLFRLILGGVFAYAGMVKIADPREFARIVADYRILPETTAVYFAYILPWLELALGVLLISGIWVRKAALAAFLLLAAFAGAVLVRHLGGATGGCGCFSLKSSGSESLLSILIRDASLLGCGAFLIVHRGKGASGGASVS
jgi:putative oxidoreductase